MKRKTALFMIESRDYFGGYWVVAWQAGSYGKCHSVRVNKNEVDKICNGSRSVKDPTSPLGFGYKNDKQNDAILDIAKRCRWAWFVDKNPCEKIMKVLDKCGFRVVQC